MDTPARCDLHVHSIYSTDTGNYALKRARLGESYTEPQRIYDVCRRRGMSFVTISDHNTVEGALRIAHLPRTFLSVEVTTRFPEDDTPLHVLVWGLSEQDHRDLQPYRPSVYELVALLRERGLAHGLAHPLYRMGSSLTVSHVERMMLVFGAWEVRNGARPEHSNELARRLALAATPSYLAKLAERHGFEPCHAGISLTAGSDDHGALDIADTWTEAPGATAADFLESVRSGWSGPAGAHGSTLKLAHAVGSLALNAFRRGGGSLPSLGDEIVATLFDEDAENAAERHEEIDRTAGMVVRLLGERARSGGFGLASLPTLGGRLGTALLAGALDAPFVAALRHNAEARQQTSEIERSFYGAVARKEELRALVFTDTFDDTNGVAGTMRRLAAEAAAGRLPVTVLTTRPAASREPGVTAFAADWSLPLPSYEALELRFPSLREVLAEVEAARPDVIQLATPGPVGLSGLAAAKLLGIPVVGSYHTELGSYALKLTKDLIVAEALEAYVRWFYRQCTTVVAPTHAIADALVTRGFGERPLIWGRGVDSDLFSPLRRDDELRARLLTGDDAVAPGNVLLLYVGRLSEEKRVSVLLEAFARLHEELPEIRLAIVGNGPSAVALEAAAPAAVTFLGELRGEELAKAYASADIFCFPSTTDTFGQVLLEAAASGLPAVAAAAGGAPELVRQGETGLLVTPDDPTFLAAAIRELALQPERRSELGTAARALALRRTWQVSYDELRRAYAVAVAPAVVSPRVASAVA